jgi:hypothetical protein
MNNNNTITTTTTTTLSATAQRDDEEESFYVLLELPEYEKSNLLTTCNLLSLSVRKSFEIFQIKGSFGIGTQQR